MAEKTEKKPGMSCIRQGQVPRQHPEPTCGARIRKIGKNSDHPHGEGESDVRRPKGSKKAKNA